MEIIFIVGSIGLAIIALLFLEIAPKVYETCDWLTCLTSKEIVKKEDFKAASKKTLGIRLAIEIVLAIILIVMSALVGAKAIYWYIAVSINLVIAIIFIALIVAIRLKLSKQKKAILAAKKKGEDVDDEE